MTRVPLQLHAALRAQAKGLHAYEAAAELLIAHASWLRRSDFLDEFVHTGSGLISGLPMATIHWTEAIDALNRGGLPCSGGESGILRIAASLADGIPVSLRDELTGLDATNIDHTARAVLHTGGQKRSK